MIDLSIGSLSLTVETKPDLFSPKRLDLGTKLLADYVLTKTYDSALDWGCGWGALALVLAANNPRAHISALDANIGAITVTKKNASQNSLRNIEVVASDSYAEVQPGTKFNMIVSHPPTHLGREVVEQMITLAPHYLTPDGELALVVEARVKPWVARVMDQAFGSHRIIKRGPKHVVLSAKNTV